MTIVEAARPARLQFSAENCPVAATLDVVGEKWTLLVIREAFYGIRRFEDFLEGVGCARNILGDRLRKLIASGVLRREAYREEGQRTRYEYRLTEQGLDLAPSLIALMQWGNRWLGAKPGPPVIVLHRACETPVHVEIRCSKGHGALTGRDTMPMPGPGARRRLTRRRARSR